MPLGPEPHEDEETYTTLEILPGENMQEQLQEVTSRQTGRTGAPTKEQGAPPHMELVNGKWEEVPPTTSPWLQVSLKPHRPSYLHAGIIPPPSELPPLELTATSDTGTRT